MSSTLVFSSVDIPGYRIVRSLGEGGMASVYLAMQESLDREVALKVMSASLAANAEFTERFLKEGRLTAKLSHPNIVTVYDIAQHAGVYYLAQEYIPGGTLRDRMDRALTVPEILDVARDVALGLAYAHEKGVVHRDVKPGNVLFRNNGTAVLADFGIAKAMNSNTMATLAGNSIGTPHYMSPEQARAEKVDGRSDLYSLGAMIVEMLTGSPPYDSSDPYTIALMHVTHPVPRLPEKSAWLQPLIEQLMAKMPDSRYPNGDAFVAACDKLIAAAPEARALRDAHLTRKRASPRIAPSAAPVLDQAAPTQRGVAIGQGVELPIAPPAARPWLWLGVGAAVMIAAVLLWSKLRPGEAPTVASPTVPAVVAPDAPSDPVETVIPDSPPPTLVEGDPGELLARANGYVREAIAPTSETSMGARKLSSPPGDNAIELYQQVLRLDPTNAEARQGLQRVADFMAARAQRALDQGILTGCAFIVDDGLLAVPDHRGLLELREKGCRL